MPELPEVETIRRRLAPQLEGGTITGAEISDFRLTRPFEPNAVAAELHREAIEAVDRRGKYLIFRFRSSRALLIHLRMTGSLHHAPIGTLQDDPYRRAVFTLDNGSDVAYRDVRRFGTWLLLEPDEVEPYLALRLGAEPLSRAFTTRFLGQRLAGRRAPLKAALLDQRTVAGLGNIYADEALWRSRRTSCRRSAARSGPRSRRGSRGRVRRCAITRNRTAPPGRCSANSRSTAARANPARVAERRSTRSAPRAAAPGTAPRASA